LAPRIKPVASAIRDVEDLTEKGMRVIQRTLGDELADKKAETSQLRGVADSLSKLAETGTWGNPVEVSFSHTVRRPDGLVTKTETLTLADSEEAKDAAGAMERKFDGWEKLRSQMQGELEKEQDRLKEIAGDISGFAESSRGIVSDVLVILHQAG
jgi:hypothetical protein